MSKFSYQDYVRMLQARFPEGKPVDVPAYLREKGNPEAAEKWEEMNDKYKDKFKEATDTEARFEEGVPADPTVNMSPEDAKKWEEMNDKYKNKFKKESGFERQRLTWTIQASSNHEAASGLYGYTKATQRDVEASVRKLERAAKKIAKTAWTKDERVASFLATHARRANSIPARILVSALKGLGPKVASTRLALDANQERLYDALMLIAENDGAAYRANDPKRAVANAYETYRKSMMGDLRADFRAVKGLLEKDLAREWSRTKTAYTPSPRVLDQMKDLVMRYAKRGRPFTLQEVYEDPSDPADIDLYYAIRELLAEGKLKGPDPFKASGNHDDWVYRKTAKEATPEFSLYGFKAKTARLGLDACSDVREAAGRIAHNLHSRRASQYEKVLGFLKEHSKKARCRYSKLLLASYPDIPIQASEQVERSQKKASSTEDWIAWETSH